MKPLTDAVNVGSVKFHRKRLWSCIIKLYLKTTISYYILNMILNDVIILFQFISTRDITKIFCIYYVTLCILKRQKFFKINISKILQVYLHVLVIFLYDGGNYWKIT